MKAKLLHFFKTETVLAAAFVLAVISCLFVPPDAAYIEYVDTNTLMLLFSLMAVMAGFQQSGFFDAAAKSLLARFQSPRGVAFVLTGLCFFCSMLITNDVALITFVPLAILVLEMAEMTGFLCFTVTLMTIAANLGSMLTPIGNPQNLYLYGRAGLSLPSFLKITLPFAGAAGVLLALCILFGYSAKRASLVSAFSRSPAANLNASQQTMRHNPTAAPHANVFPASAANAPLSAKSKRMLPFYSILFLLCLLSVADVLPTCILFIIVLVSIALVSRRLLLKVDYCLLATFICFFVFIGNMGRVPAFHDFLLRILNGHTRAVAAGASQIISNVPAALLLSGFTDEWRELIIGTNLGGLGTLIASMASLISYKQVCLHYPRRKGHYLVVFTLWNVVFFVVLYTIGLFL